MEKTEQSVDPNLGVFKELKAKAITLLEKTLPIMEDLTETDNDIVEEIVYCCNNGDKAPTADVINKWLQEQTLELVSDASKVNGEIDKFIEAYQKDKGEMDKQAKDYPFLAKVWFGDIYDGSDEIECIKALIKDIESDIKNVSKSDYFVELGIDHFKLTK